jgi:hypothetical protein
MIISVDYDDFDPDSYRAVELYSKQKLILRMNFGFEKDWEFVRKIAHLLQRQTGEPLFYSSTVHDFLHDRG